MKFYDREKELNLLKTRLLNNDFEFVYILGRRRIGKTTLIKYFFEEIIKEKFLYIFVERSDLNVFLNKQEKYFYEIFGIKYKFETIDDLLDAFFLQDKIDFLVFDEFQNFLYVDKGIFSIFQKKIDQYKDDSGKKIIVMGSINSIMKNIFEGKKEPLYKRADFSLNLKEFNLDVQSEILKDIFGKNFSNRVLLEVYSIFGGLPYYLKLLEKQNYKEYDRRKILKDLFFDEFALLLNEGKEILIEEFGRKNKRFFAILEAVAAGVNKRGEIMNQVGLGIGEIDFYLKELVYKYEILEIVKPIFLNNANITRYKIKDNFLNFWFRFVYRNKNYLEIGLYDYVLNKVLNNWDKFIGIKFEDLVKEYLILKNKRQELGFSFTKIGKYIDRRNNEIDIVCTDEKEVIVFFECKLNKNRINSSEKAQLNKNIELFFEKFPKYKELSVRKGFIVFDEKKLVEMIFL